MCVLRTRAHEERHGHHRTSPSHMCSRSLPPWLGCGGCIRAQVFLEEASARFASVMGSLPDGQIDYALDNEEEEESAHATHARNNEDHDNVLLLRGLRFAEIRIGANQVPAEYRPPRFPALSLFVPSAPAAHSSLSAASSPHSFASSSSAHSSSSSSCAHCASSSGSGNSSDSSTTTRPTTPPRHLPYQMPMHLHPLFRFLYEQLSE
jgi:hypothetical protein